MTMNSRSACKCIAVIALIAMAALATTFGMGNGEVSATPTAAMDVYAMHGTIEVASLPDTTVAEPF